MGQQQLLLVILVMIIVGITTIVAVNVLKIGADNAESDAVRQDLMQASSYVQEIWERPVALGGAGRDFTNTDALSESGILMRLNIPGQFDDPQNPTQVINENGTYSVSTENSSQLQITGTTNSTGNDLVVVVCKDEDENWIFNLSNDSPDTEGCVNSESEENG